MDINNEKIVDDISTVPATLYHLVPADLFDSFLDNEGVYDCRGSEKWGKNSQFIHTTTEVKTIKEKIIGNFIKYTAGVNFILLVITTKDIHGKFSYVDQNGTRYFHIWNSLPKNSYTKMDILRTDDGGFVL